MRIKSRLKRWLHERSPRPLDWTASTPQEIAFLVSRDHVPMLTAALASLRRHERPVPSLLIAADSPAAAEAVRAVMGPDRPGMRVDVWDAWRADIPAEWQGFADRYLAHPQWAALGKKLVLFLSLNARGDLLYSDSDILWFGPAIAETTRLMQTSGSGICIGADYQTSYDASLLERLGFRFRNQTPLNAGFVAMRHNSLIRALRHERMQGWHDFAGPFGCHTEQTLIACAADCAGAELLPHSLVGMSMVDGGRFSRQFTPRVRHYAGPKTLFWRDC